MNAKTTTTAPRPSKAKAEPAAQPTLSPREVRRQQRINLSREQILDTAEELFGERGYHDTGLKEVAERSEFSVGSIYTFFESKDELYHAVLERRSKEMMDMMADLAVGSDPADERLIALASLQIGYFRKYPGFGRLATRTTTPGTVLAGGELPAGYREGYRNAMDLEAVIITDGQKAGVVRAGDPLALARFFSSLVSAFHAMDPYTSDDTTAFTAEQFLDFIRDTFVIPR